MGLILTSPSGLKLEWFRQISMISMSKEALQVCPLDDLVDDVLIEKLSVVLEDYARGRVSQEKLRQAVRSVIDKLLKGREF
jgi:hypothetical protein